MNTLKKILFKSLSQRNYLKILHISFYLLYDLGLLKKDYRFKYHYMVKQLIKPDYTVVDIGANLGYFSRNFARLARKGHVVSIEPVPVFFETLQFFMKKFKNNTLHNVALGTENGTITMVMPTSNGMIRTGLPHIPTESEDTSSEQTQEVKILKGSDLLSGLAKIDYIKCDIEGYELTVFQELKEIITTHQPYIQVEIAENNLSSMLALLSSMNYTQYGICEGRFIKEEGKQKEEGDFFFVTEKHKLEFETKFIH
jgi:FkbM family methyltransferase